MKTHDFKVGDKVIINPDIPIGGEMPTLDEKSIIMLEDMWQPGVFTVKETTCTGWIRLNNDYWYGPTGLLHAPIYEVGDVVIVSDDCSCETNFGRICSVDYNGYTPTYLGEDGCIYDIILNGGKNVYLRSNQLKLITSPNNLIYQQENENQLQRKEVAVSRGDNLTGSSICCRRCKASITVGHLSYKEISGS